MRKFVLLLAATFVISSPAFAKMKFQKEFAKTYPNAKVLHECSTCHEGDPVNDETVKHNYYGLDLEKVKLNFKAIEALDSDGDGVSNIDEINAGTNPGVKN